jgi:sulfite reductase (NADPH) hemoprotein beta-component
MPSPRRYANRGLRMTTRQAFQFHGVIKRELKATMQAINAALIDTLAACGDVNRNVAGRGQSAAIRRCRPRCRHWAWRLSKHLLPNTRAYYELWLDEERVAGSGEESRADLRPDLPAAQVQDRLRDAAVETMSTCSPRTWASSRSSTTASLLGYNVSIGGGMGATHGDRRDLSAARQRHRLRHPDQVVAVAEAVVTAQRDHRQPRRAQARALKYTIDDRGLDAFKDEVETARRLSPGAGARVPFRPQRRPLRLGRRP